MYTIEDILRLQNKIAVDEDISMANAAILAEHALFRFDERVADGVLKWMKGELTDDFAVADLTVGEVKAELGVSAFQALCVMDIYLKNPDFIGTARWSWKMR